MSTVARERPRYFFASGCQFISSVIHRAIRPHLDVGRFQIAMNDALCVRRFERLRDLLRDGQRFVEWDRSRHSRVPRRGCGAARRKAGRDGHHRLLYGWVDVGDCSRNLSRSHRCRGFVSWRSARARCTGQPALTCAENQSASLRRWRDRGSLVSRRHEDTPRCGADQGGCRPHDRDVPGKHGWVFRDTPVYDSTAAERHWQTMLALFDAKL